MDSTSDVPILMMLPNKYIESVEKDDHCKVREGEPSGIWLELASEDKSIPVHPLSVERLVKLDIRNTN